MVKNDFYINGKIVANDLRAKNLVSASVLGTDEEGNLIGGSETDPIFSAWLGATPPLYSETDPVFTAWLATVTPANWNTAYSWGNHASAGYALLDGSNHPFTYVKTPNIRPNADSTTAIQITKADGTTSVFNVDTTNSRIGIGTTAPVEQLHLMTESNIGLGFRNASNTASQRPVFIGERARGTLASPSAVVDGDVITGWIGKPYINGDYRPNTSVDFLVTGTQSATSYPSAIAFYTTNANATSRTEKMRVTAEGYVGIGTTTPIAKFHFSTDGATPHAGFYSAGVDMAIWSSNSTIATNRFILADNVTATATPGVVFARSRGTLASPSNVVTGDRIGTISGQGFANSIRSEATRIDMNVEGTISSTSMGGRISFWTTPDGTTNGPLQRMTINNAGNVGIGTTAPAGVLHVENASAVAVTPFIAIRNTAVTNSLVTSVQFIAKSTGTATTGFGPLFSFATADAATSLNTGYIASVMPTTTRGTADMVFATSITGTNTERMRLTSAGTMVMTASTDIELISLNKTTGSSFIAGLNRFSADAQPANVFFRKSRGALNAFSVLASADRLGGFVFQGSGSTGWVNGAAIFAEAEGTFSNTSAPTALAFYTSPSGSTTVAERMRIDNTGCVGIGTSTPTANLDIFAAAGANAAIRLADADVTNVPLYAGFNPAMTANTIGLISNNSGNLGGMQYIGFTSSVGAGAISPVILRGIQGTTTSTVAAVRLIGQKSNGSTGLADLSATELVLSVRNNATELITVLGDGKTGIGVAAPASLLHLLGTTEQFRLGYDTSNYTSFTVGSANAVTIANAVAADININCGTDKTVVLTETVWADIDFPILIRTTGSGVPSLTTFNGNLTMPEWQVNDYNMCESQEFIHEWKEGSECHWHIHYTTNGLDATDRYVKFEIEYAYTVAGVWTFPAVYTTADILIPANTPDKKQIIMPLVNFTPSNSKIGDHCLARLKRVAADGTAPSGNPWIPMLQLHIEKDTLGSRQIGTK